MRNFRKQNICIGRSEYRLYQYSKIDSTNTACMEAARSGECGNLWISAERQEAGRGRNGRSWVSETGNLFTSLLLIDPVREMSLMSQLPILSAVSLGDAITDLTASGLKTKYKWPNDLLIDAAKISGILLESERRVDQRLAVVVGFGVNCKSHPDNLPYMATDIASHGFNINSDELLHGLMVSTEKWLQIWDNGRNFEMVRKEWLKKAVGIGEKIAIQLPNQLTEGKFLGIDSRGCLELELPNGENKSISAGELVLPHTYTRMEKAC